MKQQVQEEEDDLCSITSAELASSERPSARRKPGLSSSPAQLVCEVNQILRDHIKPTQPSFAGLLEIPQIGRSLILLGGHQKSVRAQVVVFLADDDMDVALDAIELAPRGARIRIAPICFVDRPRPCQRIVDHGDHVMKNVRVRLVEIEALFEDRLIVEMQG